MMKEGIEGRWETIDGKSYVKIEHKFDSEYTYSFGCVGFPPEQEKTIDEDTAREYSDTLLSLGYKRMPKEYEAPISEGTRAEHLIGMERWLRGLN